MDKYQHEILVARSALFTADADGLYGHQQPSVFTHAGCWAKRARFVAVIHAVEGAPTSWSLSATAQDVVIHDGAQWRYQVRRWFDVEDLGVIADQTTDLSTPLVWTWETDKIGADIRLDLAPVFAGGTNPGLRWTLTRELWA